MSLRPAIAALIQWGRKRSAGVAATGAIAAGVLTAVVYSAPLLPALYPLKAQSAAQIAPVSNGKLSFSYEEAFPQK